MHCAFNWAVGFACAGFAEFDSNSDRASFRAYTTPW
jgi:hypothetical protein